MPNNDIAGENKVKNLHLDGWGYKDTNLSFNKSNSSVIVSGNRYDICNQNIPNLVDFLRPYGISPEEFETPSNLNIELIQKTFPHIDSCCLQNFDSLNVNFKLINNPVDRLFASHGHCVDDIYRIRFLLASVNIVDYVYYPSNEEDVVCFMNFIKNIHLTSKCNKCTKTIRIRVVPVGGATNVSEALKIEKNIDSEKIITIAVNMTKLNKIISVDIDNRIAHIQAGASGKNIEEELQKFFNLSLGHEPDSWEFSTLGGWVATKASGMKKNRVGNIEDFLINVKFVNGKGEIVTTSVHNLPRTSAGPDILKNCIIGSEGNLGIVLSAHVILTTAPKVVRFGAIIFPDFETGVLFMKALKHERSGDLVIPSSIRLMDNGQFKLGTALKPSNGEEKWFDKLMKKIVMNRYNVDKIALCTISWEGYNRVITSIDQTRLYAFAMTSRFRGFIAGDGAGRRGYNLTYAIAYLRDFGLKYGFVGESFETCVPWSHIHSVITAVKNAILPYFQNSPYPPFVSVRLTQMYETGVCLYFYLGFSYRHLATDINAPMKLFSQVEIAARNAILNNGGSISHHHGVGKLRQQWMADSVSSENFELLKSAKKLFDPMNVFSIGNLYDNLA